MSHELGRDAQIDLPGERVFTVGLLDLIRHSVERALNAHAELETGCRPQLTCRAEGECRHVEVLMLDIDGELGRGFLDPFGAGVKRLRPDLKVGIGQNAMLVSVGVAAGATVASGFVVAPGESARQHGAGAEGSRV